MGQVFGVLTEDLLEKEELAKAKKEELTAKCCLCDTETPVKELKRIAFHDEEIDLVCPGLDPNVPCLAEDFKLFIRRFL